MCSLVQGTERQHAWLHVRNVQTKCWLFNEWLAASSYPHSPLLELLHEGTREESARQGNTLNHSFVTNSPQLCSKAACNNNLYKAFVTNVSVTQNSSSRLPCRKSLPGSYWGWIAPNLSHYMAHRTHCSFQSKYTVIVFQICLSRQGKTPAGYNRAIYCKKVVSLQSLWSHC